MSVSGIRGITPSSFSSDKMRLIIIGASGLIGSALHALAQKKGRQVLGTCFSAKREDLVPFDMRRAQLPSVVPDLGESDVVYLLAAYSNPSWIYENLALSKELNQDATIRLIDNAMDAGARLIFMSSVEVFDGEKGMYAETALPRPLNLYGRMKHAVEEHLANFKGRTAIVRTGWNVGWDVRHRCVVGLTYRTLLKPGAKMAKDNTFSIIDVMDTAEGLIRIGEDPSINICHLAGSPHVVRTELATMVKSVSKNGDQMHFEPTLFSEIPYTEPRGRSNHLDNSFAVHKLSMNFKTPQDIIQRKVALLDAQGII